MSRVAVPHRFIESGLPNVCGVEGCGMPRPHQWHRGIPDLPVTPYAGTVGWSGSDTSRRRAVRETAVAGTKQAAILQFLAARGPLGATVREVRDSLGIDHHGTASGALSNLHAGHKIDRLSLERGDQAVYVLPEYVDGRETQQAGRARPRLTDLEARALASLEEARSLGRPFDPHDVTVMLDAWTRLT